MFKDWLSRIASTISGSHSRLLKLYINNALQKYLKEELNENFDLTLQKGYLKIKDFEFEEQELTELLNKNGLENISIESAKCGQLHLDINWNILSKGVQINLENMNLDIIVKPEEKKERIY